MGPKRKKASKNIGSSVPDESTKKIRVEEAGEELTEENDKKVDMESQTSGAQSTKPKKALRGKTRMHNLSIQRAQGVKKIVEFNPKGQPIGSVACQMQSYVGILAREKVNITYDNWHNVPDEVKDQIWASVNMLFILPESWKWECLKSAGKKWRQFKSKLTKDFVYGRMESSEASELHTPPTDYPFIKEPDWSLFVIKRLTDTFKKLSEEQKERRAKIVYHYRFARKGYANFASEHPELLSDDPDSNQSTLWVEARKDKDGNFATEPPGLDDTAAQIGEMISDKKEGKLHTKISKGTILENVLGKPEHPGRVRAVGCDMTQTSYFKVYRGKKLDSETKQEGKADNRLSRECIERIAALEDYVYKGRVHDDGIDQKGSFSVEMKSENPKDDIDDAVKLGDDDVNDLDNDVELVDKNDALQGKLVTLSAESGTKIARGTVVKPNGLTMQLPGNCIRVSIDEVVDENALLPIPTDDCKSMGDALGCHVTWPMHLLKLHDEPKRKKFREKKEPTLDYSKIPISLRMVYCYCKALKNGNGTVEICIPKDVFGEERSIFVHHTDVQSVCQLLDIDYNCVAVYMWYLYKKIQQLEKEKQLKFVDPYHVGYAPSTKKDQKSIREAIDFRASTLSQGLTGTLRNQIVLVPCNVGNHWILTIIDPYKEEIGLLDPLYRGIKDQVWKEVVELALKVYGMSKTSTGRKKPMWTVFQVPKQPDSHQCGYYVMKYMKKIVEAEPAVNSIQSLKSLFDEKSYSFADIDEVRKEWAEYVQEYIYE